MKKNFQLDTLLADLRRLNADALELNRQITEARAVAAKADELDSRLGELRSRREVARGLAYLGRGGDDDLLATDQEFEEVLARASELDGQGAKAAIGLLEADLVTIQPKIASLTRQLPVAQRGALVEMGLDAIRALEPSAKEFASRHARVVGIALALDAVTHGAHRYGAGFEPKFSIGVPPIPGAHEPTFDMSAEIEAATADALNTIDFRGPTRDLIAENAAAAADAIDRAMQAEIRALG
jgi:hypothetical protein